MRIRDEQPAAHDAIRRVLAAAFADRPHSRQQEVSVLPSRQGLRIGVALVEAGLARLRALGATGRVLPGEPEFYRRFGFSAVAGLTLDDVPPENFSGGGLHGRGVTRPGRLSSGICRD